MGPALQFLLGLPPCARVDKCANVFCVFSTRTNVSERPNKGRPTPQPVTVPHGATSDHVPRLTSAAGQHQAGCKVRCAPVRNHDSAWRRPESLARLSRRPRHLERVPRLGARGLR